MTRYDAIRLPLAFALTCTLGCAPPSDDEAAGDAAGTSSAPSAPPASPVAAPPGGGRTIDAAARTVMVETLARERDAGRRMWVALGPGDPEVAALKDEITAVFEEAGWAVSAQVLTGIRLKPGLILLMAADTPLPYTAVAAEALDASGLEIKTATGYRPYYEEMKQQNPDWPGIPMSAEQDMTLVIGPRPPA